MTRLGVAFQNGSFVPYASPLDNLYTVPHLLMGFGGTITITTILNALYKTKNTQESMKLVISICITDWIYCLTSLIYGIGNVSHQGWVFGYIGCITNNVIITGMACNSLLHIVSLSMERYLAIFYQIQFTNSQYKVWIVGLWMSSVALVSYPLYTGTQDQGLQLSSSLLLCTGNWSARYPLGLAFTIIPLSVIILSTGLNCYMYTRMIRLYMQAVKHKESHKTNMQVDIKVFNSNERKLMIKAMNMTISYFLCWAPYALEILISLVTAEGIPRAFDILACMCCLVNATMNPLLLLKFDARVKKSFKDYWGLDLVKSYHSSNSALSDLKKRKSPDASHQNTQAFHLRTTVVISP